MLPQMKRALFNERSISTSFLPLARAAWVVITIAAILILFFDFPITADPVLHPTPDILAILARNGIPVGVYIWANLLLGLFYITSFLGVAILIFIRKSNDWMALLVALFLVCMGVGFLNVNASSGESQAAIIYVMILGDLGWLLLNVLFYLFPDGHFQPRWSWIPLSAIILLIILQSLPDNFTISANRWPAWVIALALLVNWSIAIYAQVYRYRHTSNAVQRQQTKWVMFGLVFGIGLNVIFYLPGQFFPALAQPGSLYSLISNGPFIGSTLALIPISLGIAVLRSRLWDIDPLINRTLVYGSLTAALAIIYFLGVVAMQEIFHALTGQHQSPVAVVISTLLIAALFTPLRRRLQTGIDRRFYRRKYDAEKMLRSFAGSVRDEVELDALTRHLMAVVDETIQPAHASLWLKRTEP